MSKGSVNKAILVGNLGNDPEVRYTPAGKCVCNLSIATSESWKDQNGQPQERTEWHRCCAFGRPAEVLGEYAKKGTKLYIEGTIKTRKWQDNGGQERYTTEIHVKEFQLLTSDYVNKTAKNLSPKPENGLGSNNAKPPGQTDFEDDEIPF